MNVFDLIGKLVMGIYGALLIMATELIEFVDSLMGSVKKKVQSLQNSSSEKEYKTQNTSHSINGSTTQTPTKSSKSQTKTENLSSLYTPQNPVPGVDLLQKEGWSRVSVHPVPETGQQVLILKNEKENKAKMLGKQAFLDYLEELNKKHGRS